MLEVAPTRTVNGIIPFAFGVYDKRARPSPPVIAVATTLPATSSSMGSPPMPVSVREALLCERRFNGGRLVRSSETIVNRQDYGSLLSSGEVGSRSQKKEGGEETGPAEKNIIGRTAHIRTISKTSTGCSKSPSSKAAADESTGGVASGLR